ncbi:MAG TPA: formylglycine-generating enzyme family protein [Verrucomicrobiales bacterium]|nr:formylglycine-generating enzyme family protein [Verrucomicrobiales bacterium]
MRRTVIATALVGIVVGIFLLGGGWKWGWFGGKGTAEEMVFDLGNGVELTLCWCPPGKFLMGSPATEAGRREDEVQHEVTLTRGFWMAKTETTQAQWKALMGDNPSHFQGDRLPVESVSWDESKAFAATLTERLRQEGKLEPGWKFRLPTEAQWEYACRAGTTTAYYTGDGEQDLGRAGWYEGNSRSKPSKFKEWFRRLPLVGGWIRGGSMSVPVLQSVGGKAENAFGLQDMHGSVWEWCEDWFAPYPQGRLVDPTGPPSGPARVGRGGSWGLSAGVCRSASRSGLRPEGSSGNLGFRVAVVPGPAMEPMPQE